MLAVFAAQVMAQNAYQTSFGGVGNELAVAVVPAAAGGIVAAGFTTSFGSGTAAGTIQQFNPAGDLEWSHAYGGAGTDGFADLIATPDGGYLAAGTSTSFTAAPDDDDVYLVKIDASGGVEWSGSYGGSGGDNCYELALASDGGYIAVGQTNSYSTGASNDAYLIKVSSTGALEWTRAYGVAGQNDFATAVEQTSDGGYIIGANVHGAGGLLDVCLIKTDVAGDTLWTRTYGAEANDNATAVRQTSDGGYLLLGSTILNGGQRELWLLRTDANGGLLWSNTYNSPGNTFQEDVLLRNDGTTMLIGRSFNNDAAVAINVSAAGDVLWARSYGNEEGDPWGACNTPDGGFCIATSGNNGVDLDAVVLKIGADGHAACFEEELVIEASSFQPVAGAGLVLNSGGVRIEVNEPESVISPTVEVDCSTVGVAEAVARPTVQLWPNPAGNVCEVVVPVGAQQLLVRTVQGQLVASYGLANQSRMQVDVAALVPGLYIVEVHSVEGLAVARLMVR